MFSTIDRHGRYAYGNQPSIAQWNLTRFAECLLPLLHPEENAAIALAEEALGRFADRFQHHWLAGMRRKLGLFNEESADAALCKGRLEWMHRAKADYTNTFAALAQAAPSGEPPSAISADADFVAWHGGWRERLGRQPQTPDEATSLRRASTPAFIPRNHVVEAALAAAEQGELGVMERLLDVLSAPYDHDRAAPEYREPASAEVTQAYRTFCGT